MNGANSFWKPDHLSHRQLLESLERVPRTQWFSLTELIAHLGDVAQCRATQWP